MSAVEILVGYLVTGPNVAARLGPDRAHAELYARLHHATRVEEMYVKREQFEQQWPKPPASIPM